jgi:hypothetical protein
MKPEKFALITGAVVGTTGLMGMISPLRKPMVENAQNMKLNKGYTKILGAVPTNDLFNFVRLGIGITGILASRKRESSVIFNRVVAGNYALMAVMGVIPKTKTMFGLMPIFGGNVWLHAVTAAGEILTEEQLVSKAKTLVPFRNKSASVRSIRSVPATSELGLTGDVSLGSTSVNGISSGLRPSSTNTFDSLGM